MLKVLNHLLSYSALPSVQSLGLEGFVLPEDSSGEPATYHAARLRDRAAYNAISSRVSGLSTALTAKDMAEAVTILRTMLAEASGKIEASNYSSLEAEAQLVLSEFNSAKQHTGLRGCPMRWTTLNDATGGAQGGDLIVVAGRPGVGKSWTMLEMARDAQSHGRVVGFASMEMGLPQIARRWLGGMTGLNPNNIRDGGIAQWSESRLLDTVASLSEKAPVHLFRGDMKKSVDGLAAMMDEFEPDILYVDAAYLLSPSARKQGFVSRWEAISATIRDLKQLAMHKNKPIAISVQFNRNQKDRPKTVKGEGKFPVPDLGDIAGTDSIPQDASILIGQTLWPQPFSQTRRVLHGMKNREGETFSFGINFNFNPVNFDEIPLTDESDSLQIADLSWMS